jgi:protein-tyrosine phosphatase
MPPHERVLEWAQAVVPAAAAKRGLVRAERAEDDDVVDPYGGPASGYREPFDLIAAATEIIARALAVPASRSDARRPEETV